MILEQINNQQQSLGDIQQMYYEKEMGVNNFIFNNLRPL